MKNEPQGVAAGRPRILLIDDEASVRDALTLVLEDEGFTVVSAARGREGLELARASDFDLTITDLRLPDISGLEVLGALVLREARRPAILITAHATRETVAEARGRGAVGVLSKPFPPSEILRLVSDSLALA